MSMDKYQELVRIKDVLTKEFVKLEALVGNQRAYDVIFDIKANLGIFAEVPEPFDNTKC